MKEKIEVWAEKINPMIEKVSNNIVLQTLMAGTMGAFPAIITGSIATVLLNIQIETYQTFLQVTMLQSVLHTIILCTINVFAFYIVFCVAYHYAKKKEQSPLAAGVLALAAFLILTPFSETLSAWGTIDYALPLTWLGGQGNFSALLIGFTVGYLYVYIMEKGWTIKLPDSVPPVILSSFKSLVPGAIILSVFAIVATIFSLTQYGSMHQAIYSLLQSPLQGIASIVWTMMLVCFIAQLLWMFGIHGPMIVIPIMATLWVASDMQNIEAYNAGLALPNIVGMAFFQVTTFGSGAIGLAINMLRAKSERYRTLGKMAIIPSIFGITEPLIFGTPIVMNLKLLLPTTLLPVFSIGFGYLLTVLEILPRMPGISTPTGTPIIVAGLIQGSWKFGLFQVVMIVLWTLAYAPFFKSLDQDAVKEEQALN